VRDVIGAKERVRIERQPSELQDLMEQQEGDIVRCFPKLFNGERFRRFPSHFPIYECP